MTYEFSKQPNKQEYKDAKGCKVYADLMVRAGVSNDFVEAYNNMHFVDAMGYKLKRFDFAGDNKKYIQQVVMLINEKGAGANVL